MLVIKNVENGKFIKFGKIVNDMEKWYYTTDKSRAKRFKSESEAAAYCAKFDEMFFWDECVSERV
jgi:hypothetical protein